MKVRFEAKFAKDLRNIKDGKLLAKVKEIIIDCQKAESLVDLKHIKNFKATRTITGYGLVISESDWSW